MPSATIRAAADGRRLLAAVGVYGAAPDGKRSAVIAVLATADASALVAALGVDVRVDDGHVSAVAVLAAADAGSEVLAVRLDRGVLDVHPAAVSASPVGVAAADAGPMLSSIGLDVCVLDSDGVVLVATLAAADAGGPLAALCNDVAAEDLDGAVAMVLDAADAGALVAAVGLDPAADDGDRASPAVAMPEADARATRATGVSNELSVLVVEAVVDREFGTNLVVGAVELDALRLKGLARHQDEVDVPPDGDVVIDLLVFPHDEPGGVLLVPVAPVVSRRIPVPDALPIVTVLILVVDDDDALDLTIDVTLVDHEEADVLLLVVGVAEEEGGGVCALVELREVRREDLMRVIAEDADLRARRERRLEGERVLLPDVDVVVDAIRIGVALDDERSGDQERAVLIDARTAHGGGAVLGDGPARRGHGAIVVNPATVPAGLVLGDGAGHEGELGGLGAGLVVDRAPKGRCDVLLDARPSHENHDFAVGLDVDGPATLGMVRGDVSAREREVSPLAVIDGTSVPGGVHGGIRRVVLDEAIRDVGLAVVADAGTVMPLQGHVLLDDAAGDREASVLRVVDAVAIACAGVAADPSRHDRKAAVVLDAALAGRHATCIRAAAVAKRTGRARTYEDDGLGGRGQDLAPRERVPGEVERQRFGRDLERVGKNDVCRKLDIGRGGALGDGGAQLILGRDRGGRRKGRSRE